VQSGPQDKEKLWMMLNNFLHYPSASSTDITTLLFTMKNLCFPFMMPDHMKIITGGCQNPLICAFLLEEQLQHIKPTQPLIEGDMLFYNLEHCYLKLNERDLRYGLFKLYATANSKSENVFADDLYRGLNYVQMRQWDKAEDILEEDISSKSIITNVTDLKAHINQYITQESWIEVQKN
jgi:hypothetical protein